MPVDREPAGDLGDLASEYEILRELGRGGMATVYLARERDLDREVAIKVIRARYAEDATILARFARESRTVAQLQHPQIVTTHAVRRLREGGLALVMQYVPGCTLRDFLTARGSLPFEHAERLLRDVGEALAFAHRRGVVHRDVKPENIYLNEETGHSLLSDFGIASSARYENHLTLAGVALGTPAYMSPEQIDGGVIDGRSDLYSLGLVGWEMLSGVSPWKGEGVYSVVYKQKHEELPALDVVRPATPEPLREAIHGALHKDPARRWASAEEFLTVLADGAPRLTWSALPTRSPSTHPATVAAPLMVMPAASVFSPDAATVSYRRSETVQVPAAVPRRAALVVGAVAAMLVAVAAAALLLPERTGEPRSAVRFLAAAAEPTVDSTVRSGLEDGGLLTLSAAEAVGAGETVPDSPGPRSATPVAMEAAAPDPPAAPSGAQVAARDEPPRARSGSSPPAVALPAFRPQTEPASALQVAPAAVKAASSPLPAVSRPPVSTATAADELPDAAEEGCLGSLEGSYPLRARAEPCAVPIQVGEVFRLAAAPAPGSGGLGEARQVEWMSSNPSVATIDRAGTVRGVRPGRTLITGKWQGLEAVRTLEVRPSRP